MTRKSHEKEKRGASPTAVTGKNSGTAEGVKIGTMFGGGPSQPTAALGVLPSSSSSNPDINGHGYAVTGGSFQALSPDRQKRMLEDLEVYRRELPQLLKDGEDGRFVLVRDGGVASVWDTAGDALQASQLLYGQEPVSVFQVRSSDLRRFDPASSDQKPSTCPA